MVERTIHLLITGRVQGVGYREWMIHRATALGLRGWVRNRRDRRVEAVACGPQEMLDVLVDACRRGPPSARVDTVEVAPSTEAIAAGAGFAQRPTE